MIPSTRHLGGIMTSTQGNVLARSFASAFGGTVLTRDDERYDSARAIWNGTVDGHPALIARCHAAEDIAAAVNLTREAGLPLAVRGGGHSVAGLSTCDDGVVIDLSPMRGVSIDPGPSRHTQMRTLPEPGAHEVGSPSADPAQAVLVHLSRQSSIRSRPLCPASASGSPTAARTSESAGRNHSAPRSPHPCSAATPRGSWSRAVTGSPGLDAIPVPVLAEEPESAFRSRSRRYGQGGLGLRRRCVPGGWLLVAGGAPGCDSGCGGRPSS